MEFAVITYKETINTPLELIRTYFLKDEVLPYSFIMKIDFSVYLLNLFCFCFLMFDLNSSGICMYICYLMIPYIEFLSQIS